MIYRLRKLLGSFFAEPYGTPSIVKRLFLQHALSHWRSYLATYLLMGIVAACTAAYSYVLGRAVNETFLKESYSGVVGLCIATVLIFGLRGIAYYGQAVLLARISNQITADVQSRLFDKLMQQSIGYFSALHSSYHIAMITQGSGGIAGALNLVVSAFGRDALLLVGLVAVMVYEDPVLALFAIVVVPTAMLFLRDIIKRIREQALAQYVGGTNILLMLQDTVHGMRVVKAFRLENIIRAKVNEGIQRNLDTANAMASLSNRPTPLMELLGGCAVAAIFAYAAFRINSGSGTPGGFVAFATAFLLAYEPSKRLARLNIDLANYLLPARVLFEFLDSPASESEELDKPDLIVRTGRLEFRNVTFSYRAGDPVLREMSFVVRPGRRTALVGISGAGKSTILSLILRFYEPESGAILLDGQDIGSVSRRSVRDHLAYVGQDTFLFSSSIRENIACGKAEVTEDEIITAAKAAHLHEFIMSLPQGYDTPVGEHGSLLSGGERQRVAIARALIKNAPVILLDEPTSGLDNETELQVREAIERLCHNRTTLVVAHRLHTITAADNIFVIEDGTVCEEGRHIDLIRYGGRYAAMYKLQSPPALDHSDVLVSASRT